MKIRLIALFLILLCGSFVMAQNYPHVSIYDIQYKPADSIAAGGDASPYMGDTVVVTGVVMVKTVDVNHKPIMWAGARWQTYLRDTALSNEFAALNVIQNDTTSLTTLMDLVDTTQIVSVTGVVAEFGKQTQLNVLTVEPIQFYGNKPNRGIPVEVTISDFATGTTPNRMGEKYEGQYVIIRNVITADRNTGEVANPFSITQDGNKIFVHGQSGYFTKRPYKLRDWTPPIDGTSLPYIRGVMGQNSDGSWVIRPLYPDDFQVGAIPPVISNVKRNTVLVSPNTPVVITATIVDGDQGGSVQTARLKYRINGGALKDTIMTLTTNDVYTATVPGVADSALVDYFIYAMDNDGKWTVSPADTSRGRYFHLVLNRPITIKDVQYTPFLSGIGAFNNYRVQVTGIVTADTSDLQGDGNQVARRVYIQDGKGPWNGLQVNGLAADPLVRGQKVTVNGLIREVNNNTIIDSTTSIQVVSTGNPLPEPVVISTSTIGALGNGTISAEQYEGVLVRYNFVKVTDDNADGNSGPNGNGNSNFGEIVVADTSNIGTRVELQEGNHLYHNLWDATLSAIPGNIQVKVNDTFDALVGIPFYSFSNYKLVPRKAADFINYHPTAIETEEIIVNEYKLQQNYPNPFNPTTTITYSIPQSGFVTVKVYNVLGKEVKTLVNNEVGAGVNTVIFNASDLSSGVYFYTIKVNDFVSTKKMMLIK